MDLLLHLLMQPLVGSGRCPDPETEPTTLVYQDDALPTELPARANTVLLKGWSLEVAFLLGAAPAACFCEAPPNRQCPCSLWEQGGGC